MNYKYKVASFKCRYNGNQKGDLSGRRVMKQKALPSETLTNVLTRSKITANLICFTKLRFGTCLSFMKCFDHFWTNDFSTKEGFKNFKLDLILHVRNLKARITFKISHKMCSMNSLASAKRFAEIQKEPIKNLIRIFKSISLTQKN